MTGPVVPSSRAISGIDGMKEPDARTLLRVFVNALDDLNTTRRTRNESSPGYQGHDDPFSAWGEALVEEIVLQDLGIGGRGRGEQWALFCGLHP